MSSTLECKRAATLVVKSLGLQADLTARAVVLAAADSTVGSSLRDLIQLNEDDPALKALVEEFLREMSTGKAKLILAASVPSASCLDDASAGGIDCTLHGLWYEQFTLFVISVDIRFQLLYPLC